MFELSNEKKDHMISVIKQYFLNERGEELGELGARLILGFFMKELASEFYNQGVFDAYLYIVRNADGVLELQR